MTSDAGTLENLFAPGIDRDAEALGMRGGCWSPPRCGEVRSRHCRHRGDVGYQGLDVRRCQVLQARVDRFAHRAPGRAMPARMTARNESGQFLARPGSDAALRVGCEIVGAPASLAGATELAPVIQGLEDIPRRVALAAVTQGLGK